MPSDTAHTAFGFSLSDQRFSGALSLLKVSSGRKSIQVLFQMLFYVCDIVLILRESLDQIRIIDGYLRIKVAPGSHPVIAANSREFDQFS